MSDNLSLPSRLIEKGLGLFDKHSKNARSLTNRRLFLESVLDGKQDDITEKDFSPQELDALRRLVYRQYEGAKEPAKLYLDYINTKLAQHGEAVKSKNKDKQLYPAFLTQYQKDKEALENYFNGRLTPDFLDIVNPPNGKHSYERYHGMRSAMAYFNQVNPAIKYDNYKIDHNKAREVNKGTNPLDSLATTLGQFRYNLDNKGNLVVNDTYDFNPPTGLFGIPLNKRKVTFDDVDTATEGGGSGVYGLLRMYAGEKMPPGKGRKVVIRVPQTQLVDPFAEPIKDSLDQ